LIVHKSAGGRGPTRPRQQSHRRCWGDTRACRVHERTAPGAAERRRASPACGCRESCHVMHVLVYEAAESVSSQWLRGRRRFRLSGWAAVVSPDGSSRTRRSCLCEARDCGRCSLQPVGPERRRPTRSAPDRCRVTGTGARNCRPSFMTCPAWLPQMGVIEGVSIVQSAVYRWRDAASLESVAGIRPGLWRSERR
jgi:hypothetical protein